MPTRTPLLILLSLLPTLAAGCGGERGMPAGTFRGALSGPGGPIPFVLEVGDRPAALVDAHERIPLASLETDGTDLVLAFDVDSRIVLREESTGRWVGQWLLARGELPDTEMACVLVRSDEPRFALPATPADLQPLAPRWTCTFSDTDEPLVALFETRADGSASGTFLTAVGDYRFLEGTWDGERLVLACFDGAHAFRFTAALQDDGTLQGDFWSRDSWHETFTARPDPDAQLPDAFAATTVSEDTPLDTLRFPDLEGVQRSLDDPEFKGRARVLIVFGSWCPNCRDATRLWAQWEARYRERGLKVVGLAFERSADLEHEQAKLRAYVERQGIEFPVLVAGLADKAKASAAFPLLDRVRSFPTTVFLDAEDQAVAVHTGFTGPAAPAEHAALTARFEELLEDLLK